MSERNELLGRIATVDTSTFEEVALDLFRYQSQYNPLYRKFLQLLRIPPLQVRELREIPFMPIQFFKQHSIKTGDWTVQLRFSSSGTTGSKTSQQLLRDSDWYTENALRGFEQFYGSVDQYTILALLPSYLQRSGSSLVYMVDQFIKRSRSNKSGFFLYNTQDLVDVLGDCRKKKQPTLLLGVTYALLDLAEQHPIDLQGIKIMETGGMKGNRKEMLRTEVHEILQKAFNVEAIHSEYGMTELLSQAYSKGRGIFWPTKSMKIMIRDITDPLTMLDYGRTGGICVADLANIDTCSFIATDDLGKLREDGSFEILGRFDASDVRGCNLMVE